MLRGPGSGRNLSFQRLEHAICHSSEETLEMSSPETASTTKPSLAQDWLSALRYWLRGRNGVIALIVLAVVIGAALNWSWLVAVGIAPLLLTVLPCAVMCGLGLFMNKIAGGSCTRSSSGADHSSTPIPKSAQPIVAASEPDKALPVSLTAEAGALPGHRTVGAVEPAPDQQS
jgi:hypothetical protein